MPSSKAASAPIWCAIWCTASADGSFGDPAAYGLALEGGKVISRGKSAHGSTPDEGVNAIEPMLRYLKLDGIADLLFKEKLGLKGLKDETGELTLSPDVIKSCGDEVFITCDIRYPATMDEQDILSVVSGCGIPYEITNSQGAALRRKGRVPYKDAVFGIQRGVRNGYAADCDRRRHVCQGIEARRGVRPRGGGRRRAPFTRQTNTSRLKR